jgi:AhpD family alkylhydroperoxidase
MKQGFAKRIFTARSFFNDLGFLIWNLPKITRVFTSKQNPKQLIEKILIVTDAVNGCMYCSWLDAKLAMKSGVSEEEIKNMMELQFHADASESELNALLFAQHFAETNRNPDLEMTNKLFGYYGEKTAKNIILAIRTVTFGNLYFNTWRAVISRFKGNPAPDSNVIFEMVYFLLNFIIILPFIILRKLDKNAIGIRS